MSALHVAGGVMIGAGLSLAALTVYPAFVVLAVFGVGAVAVAAFNSERS